MATREENEDIRAMLQRQADQRINPFMKGLSMLTGGIAGEFTGTNEDIRNRNYAKQALMRQNIEDLDQDRAMKRQMMENTLRLKTSAAGEGLGMMTGSTPEEVLAQAMEARKRQAIGTEAARMASLGRTPQGMALLANRQDPAFQSGYSAANLDILAKESDAAVQEKIQRPKIVSQLAGYGINASPDMPTGQLGSILQQAISRSQSQIPLETSGIRAKAQLKTLQGMGFVESPINVDDMSDAEAIANAEIYGRKQQQIDYFGAADRASKADTKALRTFNQLLATPNAEKNSLQEAYYNLGKEEQKNEEFRIAAQVPRPANTKETESLDKYIAAVDRSSALIGSIQSLVGNRSIPDVSQESFNGLASWMRGAKNKLGTEDPSLRSINNVVQEFQALIAQQRKDFFGASLTDNEFEVAKQLFADPNQANFLPRVLELVDSIMSKDEIQRKYTRRGIFVDAETKKDYGDARSKYEKIKSELNFGNFGSARNEKKIDSLKGRIDALQAYVTNSPASMTNTASGTR